MITSYCMVFLVLPVTSLTKATPLCPSACAALP